MSKGLWSRFYISPGPHSVETPPFDSTSSQSRTPGHSQSPAQIANVYRTSPRKGHCSIAALQPPERGGSRGHGRVLGRRHNSGLALSAAVLRLCLRDPFSPCGKTQKMRFLSFVKGFQT